MKASALSPHSAISRPESSFPNIGDPSSFPVVFPIKIQIIIPSTSIPQTTPNPNNKLIYFFSCTHDIPSYSPPPTRGQKRPKPATYYPCRECPTIYQGLRCVFLFHMIMDMGRSLELGRVGNGLEKKVGRWFYDDDTRHIFGVGEG